MEINLDQTLQQGKLFRQVNALIVSHLREHNLTQAAMAVASATMTPLSTEVPSNKLLQLVAKGLAAEKDEASRGVSSIASFNPTSSILASDGTLPAVDFRIQEVHPRFFQSTRPGTSLNIRMWLGVQGLVQMVNFLLQVVLIHPLSSLRFPR